VTEIEERLDEIRESGLYRRLRCVSGPQGPRVLLDGRPVLLLCSNNYLGLADHPRVREAAAEAAMRYGAGSGASRLISGNMTIHRRLEEQLAAFKGAEACLLFGSGFLANAGVVSALAREGDVVFSDALNHASIVDGCRLARAETFVYDHCDVEHLEWGLRQAEGRGSLIVTDGVFSMDGDVAPLAEIVELAQRYDARVMVDEAHGTGCVGPGGRGLVASLALEDEVDVVVGTLGKALGSYGAYVLCDQTMAKYLINTARTLIFSTALPPPAVAAAIAALELLREQPRRVEKLQRNGQVLRAALTDAGLPAPDGDTPIVPLIVGDAKAAVTASERALQRGIFSQAIRPPTVPPGTSRLRLAVMASHTKSELREAARVLAAAMPTSAREAALRAAAGAGPARTAASGSGDEPRRVFDGLADAA
jgi:8-amino-7-oxononanoate synthase